MSDQFYVRKRGRITGPFELEELLRLKDQGRITRVHELSRDQVEWTPAFEVDEVFRAYVELPDEGSQYFAKEPKPTMSSSIGEDIEWYYVLEGDRLGPVTTDKLASLVNGGDIKTDTLVWSTELADWSPATGVSHLSKLLKKQLRSGHNSPSIDPKSRAARGTCGGCGSNLHPSATRCASCGKKTMNKSKRWIYLSIALLLLLVILLGITAVVVTQMPELRPP